MANKKKIRQPISQEKIESLKGRQFIEPEKEKNNNEKPKFDEGKVSRKNTKKPKPFLYLFIIILVGLAIYLYFNNNKDVSKPNKDNTVSEVPITPSSPVLSSKPKDKNKEEIYTDVLDKEGKIIAKNEENWDKNRVERDGEHRTKLSDKKIGNISVPRVKINEPIYAGASELNLRRGSATVDFKEPLDEQTTAIAGHVAGRYEYFTEIKSLTKGEIITVKDYQKNKTYKYKVDKHYTVKPTQRSVLNDSAKKKGRKLVLITCHNYDSERKVFKERWIVEAFEV